MQMTFKEFIEKKYVQWQGEQGKRKTVGDFAAYLGISQPLLSMWMNGSKKPGAQNIKILYDLYGEEVSEALGKDNDLFYIQNHWENYDPTFRKFLREQAEKYETQNRKNKK